MSIFTLAISCSTTSYLPWFIDLTFQVPMQYCSLQPQTLLLSPVPSTTGCCFCLGSIQLAKTRLGADCDSDHELLIAKFRLKLKKIGKTTRPFRYDLNQIPYNYTVEVTNKFKRLDLIDGVPEELWMEVHDIVQETGIKTIPQKRNAKKQNGCLRRPYK